MIKNNTHRYFRSLTIVDVELRPLLMREGLLYKNLQRIINASIISVDVGSDVKMLEMMVEDVRREIVDRAIKLIQGFIDIAKYLGLDVDDVSGLIGLAGEIVYNNSTSNNKSIKYHGLFKTKGRDGRKMKKYNYRAQRYLIMLTSSILWRNGEIRPPRYKDLRRVLKTVVEARKQMVSLGEGWGISPGKTST